MINQFKKVFGNEKDVVVCFGDYEQKTNEIQRSNQRKRYAKLI